VLGQLLLIGTAIMDINITHSKVHYTYNQLYLPTPLDPLGQEPSTMHACLLNRLNTDGLTAGMSWPRQEHLVASRPRGALTFMC